MTESHDEKFQNILYGNLDRVIDFVKYAETKNAALLTFSSAWLIAVINFYTGDKLTAFEKLFTIATAIIFLIVTALALYSFLPLDRQSIISWKKKRNKSDINLLYFGDIADLDSEAPLEKFLDKYHASKSDSSKSHHHDLSNQIIINSFIARRKFNIFSIGACLTITAFAVMGVGFFAALVLNV